MLFEGVDVRRLNGRYRYPDSPYDPACAVGGPISQTPTLAAAGIGFTVIGDAVQPRKINDAVAEGFRAGYSE